MDRYEWTNDSGRRAVHASGRLEFWPSAPIEWTPPAWNPLSPAVALELLRLAGRVEELEKLAEDRLAYINDFEPQAEATGQENERLRKRLEEAEAIMKQATSLQVVGPDGMEWMRAFLEGE